MPSHKPVTAILDIGKTNKKFFLFDEKYSVVEKDQTELAPIEDDDGDSCENLEKLESWVRQKFLEANQNKTVQITALNFSAYGASLVHLDKTGKVVTPLYDYLKSFPEDLLSEFYNKYGGKKEFSIQSASPPMGMLNSGLQLYWLKHRKPDMFDKISYSLHLPQFLSCLFTGEITTELTSIGCHTALWDFQKKDYHHWVQNENLRGLLPPLQSVSETVSINNRTRTGPGIHDSSAALAPYLLAMEDPFILISTGTWSITFNPFNKEPLTYKELQRDCLCYLDVFGGQVKSSRFFSGSEYAHQKKKIREHFGVSNEEMEILDVSLLNELVKKKNPGKKLQLEKAYSSGPYPQKNPGNWNVSEFSSSREAYHQLVLDLVAIQSESIKLVQEPEETDKLIVTGGFSRNEFFVRLLASFFPEKKIFTSSLSDASALGAAMVVNQQLITEDFKGLLGLNLHSPLKGLNIEQYSWRN